MTANPIELTVLGYLWESEVEGSTSTVMIIHKLALGPGRQLVVVRPTTRLEESPDRTVVRLNSGHIGAFPVSEVPRITLAVSCDFLDGEDVVLVGLPTSAPEYWRLNVNGTPVYGSTWTRVRSGDLVHVLTRRNYEHGSYPLLKLVVNSAGRMGTRSDDIPTRAAPGLAARDDLIDRFSKALFPKELREWDRNSVTLAAFCFAPEKALATARSALETFGKSSDNVSQSDRYLKFLRNKVAEAIHGQVDGLDVSLEKILRVEAFHRERAALRNQLIDRLRKENIYTARVHNLVRPLVGDQNE
ncbi:hypothetical protein [Subtercola boreus]|nr:hypothetical protein [Subtercola boreus]TQL55641.1 hypothetical protein FB464_3210 [Subtercola boreus]